MRAHVWQAIYVFAMGAAGALLASTARISSFCKIRTDFCSLPPRSFGFHLFVIAAMTLFAGCVDGLLLARRLQRKSVEELRRELQLCLATLGVSGAIILFDLWLLAMWT
jgi:hypothetical protein